VANGITTAFHAVTWSWEPGLRSRDMALAFVATLERLRPRLAADNLFHLRWETFALEAEREIVDWLARGQIQLLAFNDHTPEMVRRAESAKHILRYTERTGLDPQALKDMLDRVWMQRDSVAAAVARIAQAARNAGVPLASHDDESPEMRRYYRDIGCTMAEFPKTLGAADEARIGGDTVIMGAPNVVRGGSHLNGIAAATMVRDGLCSVLTSDYYYPALLHAAFRLARDGILSLPEAWKLVSENPARAAGLADRGVLAPGRRADFILVDDSDPMQPRVAATFVGGRPVFVNDRVRLAA
jgi:alpha-D-ribose 1-methylphosphonate 5-triphosphate diphosphatase